MWLCYVFPLRGLQQLIRWFWKMNIDFIIYNAPKPTYDPVSLWGEVIYIPKRAGGEREKPPLFEFLNCYRARKEEDDVTISVEAARLESYGIPIETIPEVVASKQGGEEFQLTGELIPCLYLSSMVKSKYLILYFHSSGEDIKSARGLLDHLRNLYQCNVLAMEYPGYSVYKGSPNSHLIKTNAEAVYDYMTKMVGFLPQNIIVIGRSIGASTAIHLASKRTLGTLGIISPFSSLKAVAKELLGGWATYIVKEQHNNLESIEGVKCPLFIVHGKADRLISYQNSIQLAKRFKGELKVKFPKEMTHSTFDYYQDLSQPLRQFLLQNGINFYTQYSNGPQIPNHLYRNPAEMFDCQFAK